MRLIIAILILLGANILAFAQVGIDDVDLTDDNATKKTKALYANLKNLSGTRVLFGHQDDPAYGIGWKNEKGRSDVKEVSGSYPAVYGWDISGIGGKMNIDSVDFDNMKNWIKEAYRRGGIITISWHMENPVTNTHSWDTTRAVEHIIPGGKLHEEYKAELDTVADFMKSLRVGLFTDIPVIFRPFHEHTGGWFWWGHPYAEPAEYRELWQFTVKYLRDEKNIHNLLYAYSPDKFKSREEYMHFYPGDEWVDILGVDDYHGLTNPETAQETIKRLHILHDITSEKNKVMAITETGAETIPLKDWWTNTLLKTVQTDKKTRQVAWVLVWRNARLDHHYAPYPGHSGVENFRQFRNDPSVLFEDDLPDMYKKPNVK